MDKQTAIDILTRYRAGNCTEEERQLVERWILHGVANPLDLSDAELLEDLLDIRLRLERDLHVETPVKKLRFRRWVRYAAALLLVAFGLTLYYFNWKDNRQPEMVSITINDIEPGGNKATLTLADGQTIGLSTEKSGIVVGEAGVTYNDGEMILKQGGESDIVGLFIPKGGTYQITLSDGTKVWLNSASTLRYPNKFTGKERVVELEGEAYFEVSKFESRKIESGDHHTPIPFIVKTQNQEIEVLGTQFNVSAYHDEVETKTTLVEGAVAIVNLKSKTVNQLYPGQQSVVQDGLTTINEVDVSTFIGWKEGYFVFDGTELREAMKQLSRWYDVEVTYEGTIPRTPFYGRISRGDSLAKVLEIFKEGKVNFRLERQDLVNRLTVMP